ncbi:hypothetical protein ANCCAN_11178 [Ancylostoma caninum]|uniref:Uncharacterized protein n=1 Tax=Ancylostoma caninum TaxID=29170 RepID=A0A368GEQ2_ANCCA|nr:hypothetical protein ANCCAN_11178 [Ancylostoma caninum]
MRKEMAEHHYKKGSVSRRSAISRALAAHVGGSPVVTMNYVPDELSRLSDGSLFVHRLEPTLHVHYNSATIQMAARNGVHTLVADGVHAPTPPAEAERSALHGARRVQEQCGGTATIYIMIFRHIREEFDNSECPPTLRVVFPYATVQGSAFHRVQAWKRRRDFVELQTFLKGTQKSLEVEAWWETIKGLVFLPWWLHRDVRALATPPVPREHPAYGPCRRFLEYLENTWYSGMFSDLWDKLEVHELQTTNLAKAYHMYQHLLSTISFKL